MLEGTEENYTSKLKTPNSDWTWFQSTNILCVFFNLFIFKYFYITHKNILFFYF
jgi:hypothetical protein